MICQKCGKAAFIEVEKIGHLCPDCWQDWQDPETKLEESLNEFKKDLDFASDKPSFFVSTNRGEKQNDD